MSLLIYYLMMYGFTFALVYSVGPFKIFEKFREFTQKYLPSNLSEAYECPFCTPFQLGLLFSLVNIIFGFGFITPSLYFDLNTLWFFDIFIDGAATASGVYLINSLQEFFEGHE